jgi:hypothetical protein
MAHTIFRASVLIGHVPDATPRSLRARRISAAQAFSPFTLGLTLLIFTNRAVSSSTSSRHRNSIIVAVDPDPVPSRRGTSRTSKKTT